MRSKNKFWNNWKDLISNISKPFATKKVGKVESEQSINGCNIFVAIDIIKSEKSLNLKLCITQLLCRRDYESWVLQKQPRYKAYKNY